MALRLRGEVHLPAHCGAGGFDHGDIHLPTGRVFVAHTANGTVEVIDGPRLQHLATIDDCAEASGVLSCPDTDFVVAAARGAGHILVIEHATPSVKRRISVGGRPNGLAWDAHRRHILVADVAGNRISIVEPERGEILVTASLPGRPRWAVYDSPSDRYLVNVQMPAVVAVIDPESGSLLSSWPVASSGPHGLDIDRRVRRAFVACDAGRLVCLDLNCEQETASVEIAGGPDAIWFNEATDQVYVAIGEPGLIQVVDAKKMAVIQTFETGFGTRTTAFDTRRQELFVFRPSTCSALAYNVT